MKTVIYDLMYTYFGSTEIKCSAWIRVEHDTLANAQTVHQGRELHIIMQHPVWRLKRQKSSSNHFQG